MRAGLDAEVVDENGADAIVVEARLAFEWHRHLFDELAGELTPPSGLSDPLEAVSAVWPESALPT